MPAFEHGSSLGGQFFGGSPLVRSDGLDPAAESALGGDASQRRLLDRALPDSRRTRSRGQDANARYTQRLPGRKSDVQECQGLQKLHPFGLLPRSGNWRTEWLFVVQQNLYR